MKSYIKVIPVLLVALLLGLTFNTGLTAWADEDAEAVDELSAAATSISISPTSRILGLEANMVYEDMFKVTNNSSNEMRFEVYAAPYSYTYSEEEDTYNLGYVNETAYNQIVRWTTFRDTTGNWVETTTFTAQPGETIEVNYRIATPSSIPAGGQYEVLFAHTLTSSTLANGIQVEANPGLPIYGRASGETVFDSYIYDLKINDTLQSGSEMRNVISATAKVQNSGNIDFSPQCNLKITGIFGITYYDNDSNCEQPSVIPETTMALRDTWEDTPFMGLFNVEWTVTAAGNSEMISRTILILPIFMIILMILLLTIIIVWIIIAIRKRKERRSKFMV